MRSRKWQQLLNRLSAGIFPVAAKNRADKPAAAGWRIHSVFLNYRRILALNNTALEMMAEMERALGGEYIFDRAFLQSSVGRLSECVHHVAYNLNALTGNAYVALYDRFQQIQAKLHNILAGGAASEARSPVIPFEQIDWELEPLVGLPVVCLIELRKRSGIPILDGFVVTWPAAHCPAPSDDDPAGGMQSPDTAAACLKQSIEKALKELADRTGAVFFSVSSGTAQGEAGPAGALHTHLAAGQVGQAVLSLLGEHPSSGSPAAHGGVVTVQEEAEGDSQGEIRTLAAGAARQSALGFNLLEVTVRHRRAPGTVRRCLLRRAHPFEPVQAAEGTLSDLAPDAAARPAERILAPEVTRRLAEALLLLERLLGTGCTLSWSLRPDGTPAFGRVIALAAEGDRQPQPLLTELLAQAQVLCAGGQTVQSGIAAGTVVHVNENSAPETFPAGAIAVAPAASPRLAPLLQRAGAVLTAAGTPAAHLAAVARELRVPAVFGMPDLRGLQEGARVTVDAAERAVYAGILDDLLRRAEAGAGLDPGDPEYRLLRRLLHFILPLNLVDPHATDFTPQGCRTYHDLIHFCHERAVQELARLQERADVRGLRTRTLKNGLPLELRILDIGGGLAQDAGETLRPDDVRCEPLALFMEGLCRPDAWQNGPADLRLRDVFAGLSRTSQAWNAPAETLAGNLAIIAADSLNLSLRMGYHFSVIDALMGEDDQRNYVYFRFAGGLADLKRRERRARFIHDVLTALDFNVSQKADLVVGRLKLASPQRLRAALRALGALTSFTRQRDTVMHAEADPQALFEQFSGQFLQPAAEAAATGRGEK